jgi:nitroreductase
MLDRAGLAAIVETARLAPSVHNIQPTRWSLDADGRILLHDDPAIRIPVADPAGRDVAISHGAAIEGTLLALAMRGIGATLEIAGGALAAIRVTPDAVAPASRPEIGTRATWRGTFVPAVGDSVLGRLAAECPDLTIVADRAAVRHLARRGDDASMHFLREREHRRELLHWMRLTRAHPHWNDDGLNAEAMALSGIEARAAGLVLGPLFTPLDAVGFANALLSDRSKTESAAAILLFHRPAGEPPIDTGRAFYRAWLAMERFGLAACPISVLADWPETRAELERDHAVPAGRVLIGVFRAGPPPPGRRIVYARKPIEQLIV